MCADIVEFGVKPERRQVAAVAGVGFGQVAVRIAERFRCAEIEHACGARNLQDVFIAFSDGGVGNARVCIAAADREHGLQHDNALGTAFLQCGNQLQIFRREVAAA